MTTRDRPGKNTTSLYGSPTPAGEVVYQVAAEQARLILRRAAFVDLAPLNVATFRESLAVQTKGRPEMPRGKKFAAEQIIGKLHEAEVGLAQGKTVPGVVRKLGVTEQTYYLRKREYGGLRPIRQSR